MTDSILRICFSVSLELIRLCRATQIPAGAGRPGRPGSALWTSFMSITIDSMIDPCRRRAVSQPVPPKKTAEPRIRQAESSMDKTADAQCDRTVLH